MSVYDSKPKALSEQLLRLRSKADWLKERASDAAAKAGYIRDATDQFVTAWQTIEGESLKDSSLVPWMASGQNMIEQLDGELDRLGHAIYPLNSVFQAAIPAFEAASSSSVLACNSLAVVEAISFHPCPFLPNSSEESYATKLSELDAPLGDIYRAAWATQYDQQHDRGRAALWQMRQVFDHFFEVLAPDVAVRSSEHWKAKAAPRPEMIHRRERLTFAANRWIGPRRRTILLESVATMVNAYERLNEAHTRDALDIGRARECFRGVDSCIRQWVDSIDPWPPVGLTRF